MPTTLKTCAYCKFDVPTDASVCGHCGAKFRREILNTGGGTRFALAIWGLLKGTFSFGITALMAGYFFADAGKTVTWGAWGAVAGAVLGFLTSYSESKTTTIEVAERD